MCSLVIVWFRKVLILGYGCQQYIWGPDAEKFNPERLANGISGACRSPKAYIPFGVGQRICPGQSLAIAEMKIMYALILSNFSLSLSPNHRHPPRLNLQLEPENGVDLIIPSEDMREPKLLVHCA
ncbi:hypothetical protein VitviT2T_015999 [Vitis vinifera]|uniref:Uncharacterized protein n=2 Tax=Vitis vinifera TaxID=29760 RepID=A0ABY9CS96_VITVI|nr:cytochrome P450 714C2-like [Vitis vinifera]RVW89415.1 Cytochrome P450 714A2 [Vitis vinifera]WJZ97391.1 hypothetical protein VitviT2T_015999 [Vitis vinifera]